MKYTIFTVALCVVRSQAQTLLDEIFSEDNSKDVEGNVFSVRTSEHNLSAHSSTSSNQHSVITWFDGKFFSSPPRRLVTENVIQEPMHDGSLCHNRSNSSNLMDTTGLFELSKKENIAPPSLAELDLSFALFGKSSNEEVEAVNNSVASCNDLGKDFGKYIYFRYNTVMFCIRRQLH